MPPKAGLEFHRTVEAVERALGHLPGVTIESPKRLVDKITGTTRDHDIVITHRQAHRSFVVAIECRERSRPVGVDQIEAFHTKCANTGVNKGIVVSKLGFYQTARKKAAFYEIDCLTLDQADDLDWVGVSSMTSVGRTIIGVYFDTYFPGNDFPEPWDLAFVRPDGMVQVVDDVFMRLLAEHAISQVPFELTPDDSGTIRVSITDGEFLGIDSAGERHAADGLVLEVNHTNVVTEKPIRMFRYGGGGTADFEVAMVDIDQPDEPPARVVIVREPEGTRISVVPREN